MKQKLKNIVFDTNHTRQVKEWWVIDFPISNNDNKTQEDKKENKKVAKSDS